MDIVTIPKKSAHEGLSLNLITLEISNYCPLCGKPRGRIFGTHSFDGSRRLNVDGWRNNCGHIDKYSEIRKEGKIVKFKEPTQFNKYANEL